MIDAIIFSKDRACQLKALLDSINKYFFEYKRCDIENIYVIYRYTSKDFRKGYYKLMREDNKPVYINQQSQNFKPDLIELLQFSEAKYIILLTDDSLFTQRPLFNIQDIDKIYTDDVLNISLRIGFNTIYIDYMDKSKVEMLGPPFYFYDNFTKWNWTERRGGHLSHPFSPDGTIIKREELIGLARTVAYNSIREFEGNTCEYIRRDVKKPNLVSPLGSIIVNIPNNMTTDGGLYLKNGLKYPASLEELNDLYLSGSKININKMKFLVTSVQQEIEYVFD